MKIIRSCVPKKGLYHRRKETRLRICPKIEGVEPLSTFTAVLQEARRDLLILAADPAHDRFHRDGNMDPALKAPSQLLWVLQTFLSCRQGEAPHPPLRDLRGEARAENDALSLGTPILGGSTPAPGGP